jgi:hypothetical protein
MIYFVKLFDTKMNKYLIITYVVLMLMVGRYGTYAQISSDSVGHLRYTKIKVQDMLKKITIQDSVGNKIDSNKHYFCLEGYVDAYFALSTDSNSYIPGSTDLFQTVAPRNDQFSINVARLKVNYQSTKLRSTISMFWGDIPRYSWSTEAPYNNIQEANVGIKITKGLWVDAGFFSTHVGGEQLLPKDNMMSTIAFGTVHEPFFMAGTVLTWEPSSKFIGKLVFANDYYFFSDPNSLTNKAVGVLLTYRPKPEISLTYNNIILNRSPAGVSTDAYRIYNNINYQYINGRLSTLVSFDFGYEQNVRLDSTKTVRFATFFSGEIAAKYRFIRKGAVFSRIEFFNDKYAAISNLPTVEHDPRPLPRNRKGEIQGLVSNGFCFGGEYAPSKQSYIRFESRLVNLSKDIPWFKSLKGQMTNQRLELLITFGISFSSGNLIK